MQTTGSLYPVTVKSCFYCSFNTALVKRKTAPFQSEYRTGYQDQAIVYESGCITIQWTPHLALPASYTPVLAKKLFGSSAVSGLYLDIKSHSRHQSTDAVLKLSYSSTLAPRRSTVLLWPTLDGRVFGVTGQARLRLALQLKTANLAEHHDLRRLPVSAAWIETCDRQYDVSKC